MHPKFAKLKEIEAAQATAASVAGIQEQNARIEAKLDRVLELIGEATGGRPTEVEPEDDEETGPETGSKPGDSTETGNPATGTEPTATPDAAGSSPTPDVAGSSPDPATQAPRSNRPKTGGR